MLTLKELKTITSENRRLLTGLASGIFIFAALIYGISYNLKRENEIAQWVLRAQEQIYQIEKTISLAKDFETGSRGFLLTGSDAYELPLLEASQVLDATIAQLKNQTRNDQIQTQNLDSLTLYLYKKAHFSKTIIRLKRERGQAAAMQAFSTNAGKKYMDKIRYFAQQMHQHAKKELTQRKQENENALLATNRVLLTGIIVFIILLVYAIWKSWEQQRERKLANHQLRTEKAFSEALLRASPDGMIGFNKQGEIVLFNHRAEVLFGYSQQEVLRTPISALIVGEDFTNLRELAGQIANNSSREMLVLKKDKTAFPAEVRLNLVNAYEGNILIASIRDISQRKASELQLKESEKNLQAILSSSQEAIYLLNLDFRLVLLNDHSKMIIKQGYGFDSEPGHNFLDYFEPAFKTRLRAIYDQVLADQKVDVERTFMLDEGEAYYYSTYFPVKDTDGTIIGICCASKNITQRKKSEEAVKAANAEKEEYQSRFKAILDYSPQPILIKDTQGNQIFTNKAFTDLFAPEPGQQPDSSLGIVLDDAEVLHEFTQNYSSHEAGSLHSKEWQQQVVLQNGQVLEMEIIKFPLYDRQQQLFGICTLFKDITEQIRHQQQLVEARENAEQAERLQEQFLANMSHELRTPMNGIIGMVNLLLTSSSLQPDQKGRLQVIKRSSDTLLNLINDILDLSKIKAGMLTIDHVNFDFNDTIAGTALLFREKAKEKGIKLAVAADSFIPRYLNGDPHRLNQILNNLLSNAIKFTEKGFVRLEASLQSETPEQAIVEFVVSDSGIGIDTDKLQYIFDNFTQESTDISSKYGGTGLGLAITKRLIELQGGTIEVESIKDKGTTFTFTIPYTIADETATIAVTSHVAVAEPPRKNYSGKRALIVEDNDINQAVLTSTLQQHHLEVVIANNGQEAVDILQTGETFDIIFMDLRMPLMNGFQATAYIRQTLQLQTPIVVLTASVLRNERDRCLEIGASDYMAKPFSIADLARTLERFIPLADETRTIATPPITEQHMPTTAKAFDASRLLELKNTTYVKRILSLFSDNMPVYLQELTALAAANNKAAFLEKAHKTKGSLSAIHIEEVHQLMLAIEENAPAQQHLNVFVPALEQCSANCQALMPAIVAEVEASLAHLETSN
ncbi:PAS domain S-box protein [Pontibacter fetidus]|uniref:Sensory/regulatory protein RpfC n=1 Tax=Pontibacter fetidus TaxID=2700082 RepID=A0A6B2GWS8_9BACT|nr:PAS domain S-box protein [Pontibacter fetidus]NDK55389.1 PAS domain S-box protein [Pontibacter fetidus]